MPEYGRNVQQMIDFCLTIEDRDERNACARTVVDTICRLNPQLRNNPEWRAKLWDHLAIMSDFKLDIDYPSEPVTPETLSSRPGKVEIPQHAIVKRVYGANIMKMIDIAMGMEPDDPDRQEFVMMLANHMKKLLVAENPEAATDGRVFADLANLSKGHILLNTDTTRLNEYEYAPSPMQQRNNNKKRKRR